MDSIEHVVITYLRNKHPEIERRLLKPDFDMLLQVCGDYLTKDEFLDLQVMMDVKIRERAEKEVEISEVPLSLIQLASEIEEEEEVLRVAL
tara:strand:- start:213 stop:485 length:273 start_codon:yes stop_codon:yes gene_type:complete